MSSRVVPVEAACGAAIAAWTAGRSGGNPWHIPRRINGIHELS